jgi:hypothetical protein
LKLLIERVVVDERAAGVPRTRPKFKNESAANYTAARAVSQREAAASRVRIEWRW